MIRTLEIPLIQIKSTIAEVEFRTGWLSL